MGAKKMIHIQDKDKDVLEYLESQINMSQYVVRLIKEDMQDGRLTKDDVIRLIKEYGNIGPSEASDDVKRSMAALLGGLG